MATITVTSAGDAIAVGDGVTLREAITAANTNAPSGDAPGGDAGLDRIVFNIGGGGPRTIRVGSTTGTTLTLSEPVEIDGTSQPGFAGAPLIELDGSALNATSGLRLTGGGNTIRGLVINGFAFSGVFITGPGNNVIVGNFIGTDLTGTLDRGNGQNGIWVRDSSNNTIGGTSAADRNLIAGNGSVTLAPDPDDDATFVGDGILIQDQLNVGGPSSGNIVRGNFIGTDVTGMVALPNGDEGIEVRSASGNTIGGVAAGAGNVISGNSDNGIVILNPTASANVVQGNIIGANASGTAAIPNGLPDVEGSDGIGVLLRDAPRNTVGGTVSLARNLISGNRGDGVQIFQDDATGNVVLGNFIGTDVTGTVSLRNTDDGIDVTEASGNIIGGTSANARNVISGNGADGVLIRDGSTGNVVQGNLIGTDLSGRAALPNDDDGVNLDGASRNTIGGTGFGAGNVISGNGLNGVLIVDDDVADTFETRENLVQGNLIGTDLDGRNALPNGDDGVDINDARDNQIGGMETAALDAPRTFAATGPDNVDLRIPPSGTGASPSDPDLTRSRITITDFPTVHQIVDVNVSVELTHTFFEDLEISLVAPDGTRVPLSDENDIDSDDDTFLLTFDDQAAQSIISGEAVGTFRPETPLSVLGSRRANGTWTLEIRDVASGDVGELQAFSLTIVTSSLGARNVISGNISDGVFIQDPRASGNAILGNFIGTDISGRTILPNAGDGVDITDAPGNRVGVAALVPSGPAQRFSAPPDQLDQPIPPSGTGDPDEPPTTATITVAGLPDSELVTDLNVTLSLEHTFVGDLDITLVAPDGTRVALTDGNGGGGNDFSATTFDDQAARSITSVTSADAPFTGSFRPVSPLSSLIRRPANGAWTLEIRDTAAGDAGTLRDFALDIQTGTETGPATGNLISGNGDDGVEIFGADAMRNIVVGNRIGTDVTGTLDLGNRSDGVLVENAPNNVIGGIGSGAVNVMTFVAPADQVNLPIPPGAPQVTEGTTTSTIVVIPSPNFPADATITDVNVSLSLTHTFAGDLILSLISPDGTRVVLSDSNGGGGDNYLDTTFDDQAPVSILDGSPPFSGTFRPETPLSVLNGSLAVGAWTLEIEDQFSGDVGTLLAFSLTIQTGGGLVGNVIAGNDEDGVTIVGTGATGNLVVGNLIGTAADGNSPLGNRFNGVSIEDSSTNRIGGPSPGERNVISGNGAAGIEILEEATSNRVLGNFIGTNAAGTAALGNTFGVTIVAGSSNTIGGLTPAEGNLISGNDEDGVTIESRAEGNLVLGNLIGTDRTGAIAVPNEGDGVAVIDSGRNLVGVVVAVTPGAGAPATFPAPPDQVNLPLPPAGTGGSGDLAQDATRSQITVIGLPDSEVIADVNVTLALTHTFVGDLEIALISPNGTRLFLSNRNGGSGNDFTGTTFDDQAARSITNVTSDDAPFTGMFQPESPLAGLNGGPANGVWTLEIIDQAGGDTGTLLAFGLTIQTGTLTTTVAPNTISGNRGNGVAIRGFESTANRLQGNFIGTGPDGRTAIGNGINGVVIDKNASLNTIGGPSAALRNVISSNSADGIAILGGAFANTVQGNLVGLSVDGTELGNAINGIFLSNARANLIGGPREFGAGNVLSGNGRDGLALEREASSNTVLGNFIGTDPDGLSARPNDRDGVSITGATLNTIGLDQLGNVISGNTGNGVALNDRADGNVVQSNFIGTDVSGRTALSNTGSGVAIVDADANIIGGLGDAGRNVIAGNSGTGIAVGGGATSNLLVNNLIGVDVTGTTPLGNVQDGITLFGEATDNRVLVNVISANGKNGVSLVARASGNLFEGNRIGTDVTGQFDLGNALIGVFILTDDNVLDGSTPRGRNQISGNDLSGVAIAAPATRNVVAANLIGTDVDGAEAIANAQGGVLINDAGGNTLVDNTISGNLTAGVQIFNVNAGGNRVVGNRIGTDLAGRRDLGNSSNGVFINNAPANEVAFNVISGNDGSGVEILGDLTLGRGLGNVVGGNLIGTDLTGRAGVGNSQSGVFINFVGDDPGLPPGVRNRIAGNTISGNGTFGVQVAVLNARGNDLGVRIEGNRIGTDVSGQAPLANSLDGININNAPNNLIAGNTISGNGEDGVELFGPQARGNRVFGNFLGTNLGGTAATPNGLDGVRLTTGAVGNSIGGTAPGQPNVISGNRAAGVEVLNEATGNLIQANRIGTNLGGTAAVANRIGVFLNNVSINVISGNLISGNVDSGVQVLQIPTITNLRPNGLNQVLDNLIGTDALGSRPLETVDPQVDGVIIVNSGSNQLRGNVLSGNARSGVQLTGQAAAGNVVAGNAIGAGVDRRTPTNATIVPILSGDRGSTIELGFDPAGRTSFDVQDLGVSIDDASSNLIGGPFPADRNIILGNGTGVEIRGVRSQGNTLVNNQIGGDQVVSPGAIGNPLGGNFVGVSIVDASNNLVGLVGSGLGNQIDGNLSVGVQMLGPQAAGNRIQANTINNNRGLAVFLSGERGVVSGAVEIGVGVYIEASPSNMIGGPNGALNDISGNRLVGVFLFDGADNNLVQANRITFGPFDFDGNPFSDRGGEYGVLVYNAANNVPEVDRSNGPLRNIIIGPRIAQFREFTGNVVRQVGLPVPPPQEQRPRRRARVRDAAVVASPRPVVARPQLLRRPGLRGPLQG